MTPTSESPNIALVQRFFAAYAAHDLETMREEIFAPDVTWHIPGHYPLAGVKRGADEILAYFAELPKANFQAKPIVIAAQGDYVIDVHRDWAAHSDASLDTEWVLVYRIPAGRIQEVINFAAGKHAADRFFWEVWGDNLRPLPERLRNEQARSARPPKAYSAGVPLARAYPFPSAVFLFTREDPFPRLMRSASAFASDAVAIAVKVVWVGLRDCVDHAEVAVRDL